MRILKITLLMLVSVILQTSLIARIHIFGSRPDLLLALVVSVALFKGPLYGELVGFTSGLLCDLLSGGPFLGIQSFSKVVIGYCTGFINSRFYSNNFITQSTSGFIATLIGNFITAVHLSLLFLDPKFLHIPFVGLILIAILNSVLVVAVFWVLRKFTKSDNL